MFLQVGSFDIERKGRQNLIEHVETVFIYCQRNWGYELHKLLHKARKDYYNIKL